MGIPGNVTLASLRIRAGEAADMINSSFVSIPEWNSKISVSYKELYDLLISSYGADYEVATPYSITTDGSSQLFALPDDFYKLLGVDLAMDASTDSYVTLMPFSFAERNRFAVPNFQSFYGITNLRYRLNGNNLWLTPVPSGGQTLKLWYIPQPTNLQVEFIANLSNGNAVVSLSDTSQLSVGMKIATRSLAGGATDPIQIGTTIASITANTSITLSSAPTADATGTLLAAWNDSAVISGISGWEAYVESDAAIKALGKEESDSEVAVLAGQKAALKLRIEEMAENRDAGAPATVADTQYSNFWWPTGSGNGDGWGVL